MKTIWTKSKLLTLLLVPLAVSMTSFNLDSVDRNKNDQSELASSITDLATDVTAITSKFLAQSFDLDNNKSVDGKFHFTHGKIKNGKVYVNIGAQFEKSLSVIDAKSGVNCNCKDEIQKVTDGELDIATLGLKADATDAQIQEAIKKFISERQASLLEIVKGELKTRLQAKVDAEFDCESKKDSKSKIKCLVARTKKRLYKDDEEKEDILAEIKREMRSLAKTDFETFKRLINNLDGSSELRDLQSSFEKIVATKEELDELYADYETDIMDREEDINEQYTRAIQNIQRMERRGMISPEFASNRAREARMAKEERLADLDYSRDNYADQVRDLERDLSDMSTEDVQIAKTIINQYRTKMNIRSTSVAGDGRGRGRGDRSEDPYLDDRGGRRGDDYYDDRRWQDRDPYGRNYSDMDFDRGRVDYNDFLSYLQQSRRYSSPDYLSGRNNPRYTNQPPRVNDPYNTGSAYPPTGRTRGSGPGTWRN